MPGTTNPPKPLVPWPAGLPVIHLSEELVGALALATSPMIEWDTLIIEGRRYRLELCSGPDHALQLHAEPVDP